MADNEEYNRLVNKRSEMQREKEKRLETIKGINNKLDRLKPVKTVLTNQKAVFNKSVKQATKKCIEDDYSWTGSTYDNFIAKGNELMAENNSFHTNQLDRLLDELNNEITSLENEINNQFGIIGKLVSGINSLSNSIENLLN